MNEIGAMRRQMDAKRQAIKRLREAPVPLQELHARIDAAVRATGAMCLERLGPSLARMSAYGLQGDAPLPGTYGSDLATFPAWCAAEPEEASRFVKQLYTKLSYEAGPASADRPAMLAQLESELAELEAAEEKLIDEAVAAGVTIPHRPEVILRRANEARERELNERHAATLAAIEQQRKLRHVSR
jgi:hypothetical protein